MKKLFLFAASAVCFALIVFAGCGGPTLSSDIAEDGLSCTITADKAGEGDFVSAGGLEVGDSGSITVESQLEGDGGITVDFISASTFDPEAEDQDAALQVKAAGSGAESYTLPSDTYQLSIVADKGATGTVTITVDGAE